MAGMQGSSALYLVASSMVVLLGRAAPQFEASAEEGGIASQRSPFSVATEGRWTRGPILRLERDELLYRQLRERDSVILRDFPLPGADRHGEAHGPDAGPDRVDLKLSRVAAFAPEAKLVLGDAEAPDGIGRELASPDVTLFRGSTLDNAGSRVFLGLTPEGVHGYVITAGRTIVISSGKHGEGREAVIYDHRALPEGLIQWRDFVCDVLEPQAPVDGRSGDNLVLASSSTCYRVEVAIETNVAFTQSLFGGDTNAALAYVAILLGASSEIFEYSIDTELEVVFVRLWDQDDPWSSCGNLGQVRSYWNQNMGHIDRNVVHFLGGGSFGGQAYLGGVCHPTDGYAGSCGLNGFFPYPLQHYHDQNWDIYVVPHEFGHTFGTLHTHDGYCPPLDQCIASFQCQTQAQSTPGTIMSYCNSIALELHPVIRRTIRSYFAGLSTCDLASPGCTPAAGLIRVPQDVATLNEAVTLVASGGTIRVGPGTYDEKLILTGKPLHLVSTDGPEHTVIDATHALLYAWGSTIVFHETGGSAITIEGFTITGGTGSPAVSGSERHGGGVHAVHSHPMLIDCIIKDNTAVKGGGMANFASDPTLVSCVFIQNAASSVGGGMHNAQGAPLVLDSRFHANTAVLDGGGIFSEPQGLPAVSDTLFCENAPNHLAGPWTDGGGNELLSECPATFVAFCFGDGTGAACPCGNPGAAGGGCANSTARGAVLSGAGSAEVAADDLMLSAAGLPLEAPAVVFVGLNALAGGAGQPFADGLRCVGGGLVRLGVQLSGPQGQASWGPGLGAAGAWQPGDVRRFQAWYRDVAGPCGNGSNLSNGLELSFH